MKSLSYLNKYLYKYRYRLLAGIFFIVVSNLFAIYPAQITRFIIDFVTESTFIYPQFSGTILQQILFRSYAFIFLGFFLLVLLTSLLKGLFMFFMRQTIIVMSRWIEFDLKNEVFAHYQQLSMSFYKRNNTGDLMARISEDVSQVRMYLGPGIMYSLNLLVLFVVVIITMLKVNARLSFYVLLPLPLLSIGIYYVSYIINRKSDKLQAQLSRLATYVQEAFSGIRVLKSFNRERYSSAVFDKESEQYKKLALSLAKTDAWFQPLITLFIGISTLFTIYIGGKQAINGTITIGNIAEFVMYVNILTWPFTSVGWIISIVQRAAVSQRRVNEFLTTPSEIISVTSTGAEMPVKGLIEFRNVSFVYTHSGIKALDNVSFTIHPGQSLAILGKTGSGKSTIPGLICRHYDVTEGAILIDGVEIKKINLHYLREHIGYVPQEVFLFSDTITNNIAFGLIKEEYDMALIEKAAKDAEMYESIMKFPQQFNTLLGERGINLSGGQKQRISIARAIVKAPQLLIFDDCLSAVDTETEDKILRNLKEVMKNKTSISISHRVSSIRNATHIIVLDKGKIIEEGDHTLLLKKKGLYYDLYQKQLLENTTVAD